MTRQKQEQLLNTIAQTLMDTASRTFRPMYPWILVRKFPRAAQIGSIVLPDIDMNKVVHEGIVVRTWEPCLRPTAKGKFVERRSEMQLGDHVLFPHWAGVPVDKITPDLPANDYRLIREDWESNEGGLYGVVHYEDAEIKPENVLLPFLEAVVEWDVDSVAEALQKRFLLVDREAIGRIGAM